MNLRCGRHTKHAWSRENTRRRQPLNLFRRAVQLILKMELLESCTARLATSSNKRDEEIMSALSASERRKPELSIRKAHHNCGHPPDHVLLRMLRWNGAKDNLLAAARLLRASACEEDEPLGVKPVSAYHENRGTLESGRSWNHRVIETLKVYLWICVDEGHQIHSWTPLGRRSRCWKNPGNRAVRCGAGAVRCGVVSCGVVSCRVVSCRVVWCRVVPCRVVSCRAVQCRVAWCGVV